MRLFVGIELASSVKAAAGEVSDRLRSTLAGLSPGFDARWVPPENLHLTLAFLGEVREPAIPVLSRELQRPIDIPAFVIRCRGCGAFPRSGPPRVIWLGVAEGGDLMTRLYAEVAGRLEGLGFPREARPYAPHVTLARVKHPGLAPRRLREALSGGDADCGDSTVAAVTLFRSRLSPRGAVYDPVLRVPLP